MSTIESTMFFPRLRRQAKWMFVFLALAFAVGFVVFNVGSGGGGTGVGDLLLTPGGSGTGEVSAGEARDRIEKNPGDVQAYRDLATALESEGDTAGAISALEASSVLASGAFVPSSQTQLGQAIGQDPITEAVQTRVNERLNDVFSRMQTEYRLAVSVYADISRLRPRDATIQFELAQAAEAANDTQSAIAAYERFLELAPDDPSAQAIRERIKLLRSPAAAGATG